MRDETLEKMLEAIKSRKKIPQKQISVSKLLEVNNMSEYEYVCCNRLAEQIDEKHIMFDLFSGNGVDIVLDYVGLIKSEDILQGYIPLEKLEAYEEYVHLENRAIESQNTELEIIRGCQTDVIKSTLKSPEKYFDDIESVSDLLVMLRAELKARGLYNRVRLLVGNGIDKMLFWLKNYRIIRIVKRCAADNI